MNERSSSPGREKAQSLKGDSDEHYPSKNQAETSEDGTAVLINQEKNGDRDVEKSAGAKAPVADDESHYVDGYKLFLIFIGMLMSIFLVSLDQTIGELAIRVPPLSELRLMLRST